MKDSLKRACIFFLNSWWLPPLVIFIWSLLLLGPLEIKPPTVDISENMEFIVTHHNSDFQIRLQNVIGVMLLASVVYSWILLLRNKRRLKALLSFLLTVLATAIMVHFS